MCSASGSTLRRHVADAFRRQRRLHLPSGLGSGARPPPPHAIGCLAGLGRSPICWRHQPAASPITNTRPSAALRRSAAPCAAHPLAAFLRANQPRPAEPVSSCCGGQSEGLVEADIVDIGTRRPAFAVDAAHLGVIEIGHLILEATKQECWKAGMMDWVAAMISRPEFLVSAAGNRRRPARRHGGQRCGAGGIVISRSPPEVRQALLDPANRQPSCSRPRVTAAPLRLPGIHLPGRPRLRGCRRRRRPVESATAASRHATLCQMDTCHLGLQEAMAEIRRQLGVIVSRQDTAPDCDRPAVAAAQRT